MLVEFRVSNYRSFHPEQTLSLVASKDKKHPGNLIPCGKFKLLKSAAIYGPNASGKSNLIRAMDFMAWYIQHSATALNQGDPITGGMPFRLDVESRLEPSTFEITAIVEETRFRYGFSVTRERVYEEWLTVYPGTRGQGWLERRFDPKTKQTTWKFRSPLKSDERILRERTRDNGLVLSRGADLNIKALSELFLWFRNSLWIYDLSKSRTSDLMQGTSKLVVEDRELGERVNQMVRHADFGIEGIRVDEPETTRERVKEIKPGLAEQELDDFLEFTGVANYDVYALHRIAGTTLNEQFDMERDESNGTQRFFAMAGPVIRALNEGGTLVLDEIDCSMHPLLTRKIIELFQSPDENKKGAQLIFATHDTTLMDPGLFRRDQVWLVEKDRSGASQIFSLYDFDTKDRPRNTEAFERNYLAGRYGGVPQFGPIFEDLEIK